MEWVKPRIKLSHHVIVNRQGDICIGEIPGFSKVVRNPPEWFVCLLERLDGRQTLADLVGEMEGLGYDVTADEIVNTIQSLGQFNLLEDAAAQSTLLSAAELERYDRQIRQFSLLDKKGWPGFAYQEQLKKSTVLVLGVGGWGTWVALQLALLGVGTIRLVDGDEVDLSNLNRQVLYTLDAIGKSKVLAAREKIRDLNPHVNCEVYEEFVRSEPEQMKRLLDDASLAILAWTNLGAYRRDPVTETFHQVALNKKIATIEFAADPLEVIVGPIYLNDGSHPSYFQCQEKLRSLFYSADERTKSFQDAEMGNDYRDGNRIIERWHSCPPLSIASGMVADQATKVLTGYDDPVLVGKRFRLSLRDLESRIENLY